MIKSGKFGGKRILLIDKESKTKNDRTWCFWEKEAGFFEDIVYKKWDSISVLGDETPMHFNIQPYQYKMIRGIDFYNFCFSEISKNGNIDIVYGNVSSVILRKDGISIDIDNIAHRFEHATVFNSFTPKTGSDADNYQNEINLLQHFKGWVVETPVAAFSPERATFMDFRVNQERGTTFAYVLPFSETKALVEYTLFTKELLNDEDYESELKTYLKEFLKITDYTVTEKEFGLIPMTTKKFQFFSGEMYYIGTAGGQTKASSGYTFQFIQKQSEEIVNCLIDNKTLTGISTTAKRFQFYDRVLLDVLFNDRVSGKEVFTTLFKKNHPHAVLRFLDNESSLKEELKIISTLPTIPFLKAALKQF
jgi:lycopene beta-cyclase